MKTLTAAREIAVLPQPKFTFRRLLVAFMIGAVVATVGYYYYLQGQTQHIQPAPMETEGGDQ